MLYYLPSGKHTCVNIELRQDNVKISKVNERITAMKSYTGRKKVTLPWEGAAAVAVDRRLTDLKS